MIFLKKGYKIICSGGYGKCPSLQLKKEKLQEMGKKYDTQAYKMNAIKTASPARLTSMLYDAAVRFTDTSIELMEKEPDNYEEINKNLKKAQDCIMELRMGLDFKYPVAGEFEKVYDYIYRRLVEGNMKKDVDIIKDTLTHINTMRDTWREVVRLNKEGKAK